MKFEMPNLNDKRIIQLLSLTALLLIFGNIVNEILDRPFWQITRFISVGMENNFATWFSSLIYIVTAYYAYQCSQAKATLSDQKLGWQLFALLMLGLSCDETSSIHEHLGGTVNKYLFNDQYKAVYGAWTIVVAPIAFIILIFFIVKLRESLKGSKRAALLLILGAFVILTGGIFLESMVPNIDRKQYLWLFKIELIMEESFEIFGSIIVTAGLMAHKHFLERKTL